MLEVLEELLPDIERARASAYTSAEAESVRQAEINDELAFLVAMGETLAFDDYRSHGKQDGENDVSFIQNRVMERGAVEREAGDVRLIKLRRGFMDCDRGEVIEMARSEAEWQVKLGVAEWFEETDDPTEIPEVGDRLRIACLIRGVHGA